MTQLLVVHVQPAFNDSSKFIIDRLKKLKGIAKANWIFCHEDQSGDEDISIYQYLQEDLRFRESTAARIMNQNSISDYYGFIREALDCDGEDFALLTLEFMHKNKLYNIGDEDSANFLKFLQDKDFFSKNSDCSVDSLQDFRTMNIVSGYIENNSWPVDIADWLEEKFSKNKVLKLSGGFSDKCLKEIELLAKVLGFNVELTDAVY